MEHFKPLCIMGFDCNLLNLKGFMASIYDHYTYVACFVTTLRNFV